MRFYLLKLCVSAAVIMRLSKVPFLRDYPNPSLPDVSFSCFNLRSNVKHVPCNVANQSKKLHAIYVFYESLQGRFSVILPAGET